MTRSPRFPLRIPATYAGALALLACGASAPPAAVPGTPPSPPAPIASAPPPPAAEPAPPLPPGVPDTAVGHQLAWVLAGLVKPPTEADVAERMSASFLAQVPADKFVAILGQLGQKLSPVVIDRIEPRASPEALDLVVHSGKEAAGAGKTKIAIHVEAAEPHRISGLLFSPSLDAKPAASWDEVKSGLRAVAPQVGFLAAEVHGGQCVALSSLEPKKPMALGSAFKLYILETLAAQIAAGKHTWDETIAIDDAKKSLPSGDMRNEPAGKTFTVRHMAEQMISVSDNTATDHLLAFVGRAAVEADVKADARAAGHPVPSPMIPLFSTRDLFAMKLLLTPEELGAYARADIPHKRALLETYEARDLSQLKLEELGRWDKPRMVDSLEWFASPEDLCQLMVSLKRYAYAPATAPVGAILSMNPGIPDEKGLYSFIAYKGGSEPGVLELTWLLQRKKDGGAPGSWRFLVVGFSDPGDAIDEDKGLLAAAVARDFLGVPAPRWTPSVEDAVEKVHGK